MPARTSARSSANASSPPKRQSQSPTGRRTRSTRSQSIELGTATNTNRRGARGARQTSVDSVNSDSSTGTSRAGRTRKAVAAAQDLSIVQEDPEMEQAEEEVGDADADADEEEEEDNPDQNQLQDRMRSPGGMSQMSGTTAITSFSTGEIAELDPMIAEILPELLSGSYKILDLLAPPDASEKMVESIVKDLKVFGSRRAKRLKYDEEKFRVTRENYGSNVYITTNFILRKLLGTAEPGGGSFRPDAIIYAANLATLIKEFLVAEKESQAMHTNLTVLDTHFPEPFLSEFNDNAQFGSSAMLRESFNMALEIRTMYAIADLSLQKESEKWDPDQLLATCFFDPLPQRSLPLSYIEDAIKNGHVKDILRGGPLNSEDESEQIVARVEAIRSTFRYSNDAIEAGDLVDFEQLEDQFRWSTFLTNLVRWSRSRLTEINWSIQQQGGAEAITESLIETIRSSNSQIELNYEPPSANVEQRGLLPAANIVRVTTGQSFNNKSGIRVIENMRQSSASLDPTSSNQRAVLVPSSLRQAQSGTSRGQFQGAPSRDAQSIPANDLRPAMGDNDDVHRPIGSSTEQVVDLWIRHENYKNKENKRPSSDSTNQVVKKRLTDRQDNAQRIQWDEDSQDAITGISNRKRPHQEEDEEEVSQDEGFEDDQRMPDPTRRAAAPTARSRTPVRASSSPKRARVQYARDPIDRENRRNQERAEEALQASARGLDDDDDSDTPAPTYTQVKSVAKTAGVRMRLATGETQKRKPWSQADEQLLLNLIEQHGCSWALIARQPGWEDERPNFQVQVKDKARNMKVSFLKAQMELPVNFEQVALGKKEIAAVRSVVPDYES